MTITEHDVGRYFIDPDGEIWRCIAYTSQPTATLQKVKHTPGMPTDHQQINGAASAPIFDPFQRLGVIA